MLRCRVRQVFGYCSVDLLPAIAASADLISGYRRFRFDASMHRSIHLYIHASIIHASCIRPATHLTSILVHPSVYLSTHPSIHECIHISIHPCSLHACIHLSILPCMHVSIHPCACPFIIYLSISIHPSAKWWIIPIYIFRIIWQI